MMQLAVGSRDMHWSTGAGRAGGEMWEKGRKRGRLGGRGDDGKKWEKGR